MRIILAILASITFLSSGAQTHLPVGSLNYTQGLPFPGYNQLLTKNYSGQKWYINKYAGLSAGTIFFGGNTSYVSVPVGLQLVHPLNKNLYGFAGISAAPTIFSYRDFSANPHSFNTFSNGYGLGVSSRVEMGLMYINDEKTFSISGSVGIERGSYPVYYPSTSNRANTRK